MRENNKKTIVIFGGSGGIGFEATKYFFKKGYNLVVTYNKNPKLIKNFISKKKEQQNKIFTFKCSFFNQNSIKKTIKFAFKQNHEVSCVINCVGIFEYDNLKSFNYKKISQDPLLIKKISKRKFYFTLKKCFKINRNKIFNFPVKNTL